MPPVLILAQADEGGFHLPAGAGEWAVWMAFAAVVVSLWLVLRRTRRRADQAFRDRRAREKEERRKRLEGE